MSVIITKFSKDDIVEMSGVMNVMNAEMNNIKSVDGLIEKIQDKMQHRDRAYRRDEISKKQLDIELCTYAEVIDIIKECCEVLDYGDN